MKVEDIQIGDWVQNPLGAPYQVFAIHFYKINGDGDGYYGIHLKNKGAEARLEIYDLHPVPLTPEILEKNGFRVDGSGTNSRCLLSPLSEQGIRFNIYVGLKYKTIDVFAAHPEERTKGWRKSNKVYLEISGPYVHELQHALRLCGIEKTIEL